MVNSRDTARWKVPLRNHSNLPEFFASESLPSGLHSISFGDNFIDFLLKKKESHTLLVSFSGALPPLGRENVRFPVFSGTGVSSGLDCSLMCIADPSLTLLPDLRLAWYVGSNRLEFQPICVDLIQSVAERCGASRIVFLGGSGGGFAALNYSIRFPGSLAVAMNPQTDIALYSRGMVNKFSQGCFGVRDFEKVAPVMKARFRTNLLNVYGEDHPNHFMYLQNLSDPHLSRHAIPFAAQLGAIGIDESLTALYQISERGVMVVGDWGEGHVTPPKDVITSTLQRIFSTQSFKDDLLVIADSIPRAVASQIDRSITTDVGDG